MYQLSTVVYTGKIKTAAFPKPDPVVFVLSEVGAEAPHSGPWDMSTGGPWEEADGQE